MTSLSVRNRVPFIPNRALYENHYRLRGGVLPVFRGTYQDGSGLLSNLFRSALPILKSTALSAGKTLLKSGADVLSDISSGRADIKTAIKQRGMEGLKSVGRDVLGRTVGAIREQTGGKRKRKKLVGKRRGMTTRTIGRLKRKDYPRDDIFDDDDDDADDEVNMAVVRGKKRKRQSRCDKL